MTFYTEQECNETLVEFLLPRVQIDTYPLCS